MQTQNTLVTLDLLQATADRALQLRPAPVEKSPTMNSASPARQVGSRRSRFAGRADASVAWMAVTVAILGVLTAMLMMGIAISV